MENVSDFARAAINRTLNKVIEGVRQMQAPEFIQHLMEFWLRQMFLTHSEYVMAIQSKLPSDEQMRNEITKVPIGLVPKSAAGGGMILLTHQPDPSEDNFVPFGSLSWCHGSNPFIERLTSFMDSYALEEGRARKLEGGPGDLDERMESLDLPLGARDVARRMIFPLYALTQHLLDRSEWAWYSSRSVETLWSQPDTQIFVVKYGEAYYTLMIEVDFTYLHQTESSGYLNDGSVDPDCVEATDVQS